MTGWDGYRIPIWLPPLSGEALDSYLAAYARRLAVAPTGFLRYLGLPGTRLDLMVRQVTGQEADAICRKIGLTASQLTDMTLEPWNGLVISIVSSTRKLGRPPAWWHTGKNSRYCPACLLATPGRWQLLWRLPWMFACTQHQLLLLDRCPRCGSAPSYKLGIRSEPGACTHGRADAYCGFPLAQTPSVALPPDGRVLLAQQRVGQTVLGPDGSSDTIRQQARELAALAQRALRAVHTHLDSAPPAVQEIIFECGGALPTLSARGEGTGVHSAAVGTAIAAAALGSGQPVDENVFAWLLKASRARRSNSAYPITWAHRWTNAGPQVAARVVASVGTEISRITRIRYGTTTSAPSWTTLTDADVRSRAARIPAMLWPAWTMRVLPRAVRTDNLAGFRRVTAALMLLPGSQYTYRQAARLLGNKGSEASRFLVAGIVGSDDRDGMVLTSALVLLARALDEHLPPIDYQRRRELFADGEVSVDDDAYRAYCRRQGGVHATDLQVERLRWRTRQLLLGAEPGVAARTPAWHVNTYHLLDHELKALLQREAEANLHAHGLDEPVSWEPPGSWLPDLEWPGMALKDLDRKALAAAMRVRPSLAQAAQAAGAGPDYVRLFLESEWVHGPAVPATPSSARGQGIPLPLQGVLEPAELRRLYHDQHLSMQEIGEMAGCSTVAISKLLKGAGIPSRRRQGPMLTADGEPVSAEWLERQYVRRGRTTLDIAAELACDSGQVSDLLKRYGIPARGLFAASSPLLALEVALSPAMRSVTTIHNQVARLRNIVRLPGHRNIKVAAEAMGLNDTSIRYQLKRIEQTVGFAIIAPR